MKVSAALAGSLCLWLLGACIPPVPNLTPRLQLHPVRGPLALQYPNAAITGHSTGFGSGSISFELPSGESCKGAWEPIPQNLTEPDLASCWDAVYGEGYFTRQVLGSKWRGKSQVTGNRGAQFRLEFYRGDAPQAPLLGIAQDAAGNVYKVTQ